MYYYLKGYVVELGEDFVVIDVHDVGYRVLVMHPNEFVVGEEVLVYIAHIIREDEEYFVGFKTLKDKAFFNKLINCKGIGPKTALSALRGISVEGFIDAVEREDVKLLKKLDGIGPKAASQIILDLKGTLVEVMPSKVGGSPSRKINLNQDEALQALKSLGFKEKDILDCFDRINNETLTTEEYITQSLRMIRK